MDLLLKFFEGQSLLEIEQAFNAWSKGQNYWVKDTVLLPRKSSFILTVQFCQKSPTVGKTFARKR